MAKLILGFSVALLLGSGCGKDEAFENAKVHKCNLEKYMAEAQPAPDDKRVMEKVKETTSMLSIVVEGASDPTALRAKLAAHKCAN